MVRPTGKVLYEVGFVGKIGKRMVKIVPLKVRHIRGLKKAIPFTGEIREA